MKASAANVKTLRPMRNRRGLLPVIAIAMLGLLACEPSGVTEVTPPVPAPSQDLSFSWGTVKLVKTGENTGIHIRNTATIGKEGGMVRLGLHQLIVPAGAVAAPTVFSMSTVLGGNLVMDLKAADKATGAEITKFRTDLQLKLSYWMLLIPRDQVDRLVIVWLKDETLTGRLEPVPTTRSTRDGYIIGWIDHFSRFAMGIE